MTINFRNSAISSVGVGIMAATLVSEADAQDQPLIEEVVVTAEKREASVQDVPISISAISGDALEALNARNVDSLPMVVPNMSIGYRANNIVLNLRGVETNIAFNEVANPAVAFNIDGVYLSSVRGGADLFHDLERVEVLRGPQGTLAGRNSTAGSINLVTRRPHYDFEASAEVEVGDFDHVGTKGVINLPLVEDRVALRASFVTLEHDGYLINNRVNPEIENADDADNLAVRASVLFDATEDLSILLKGYYQEFKGVGPQFVPFLVPEESAQTTWAGLLPSFGFQLPVVSPEDPSDPRVVSLDTQPVNDVEVSGVTAELTWDLNAVGLTYIGNYHKDDNKNSLQDLDGMFAVSDASSPAGPGVFLKEEFGPYSHKVEQTSHELRLSSNANGSPLDWVTGLYYFDQEQDAGRLILLVGDLGIYPGPGFAIHPFDVPITEESLAAYGDVKYRLTDEWELTAGVRYTDDEQTKFLTRNIISQGNVVNTIMEPEDSPFAAASSEAQSDNVDWRAGLTWYRTDDSMVYATISTGYKGAGADTLLGPFEEETVTAYEIGTKNTVLDGRLRLNAAVFFNDYDGIQIGSVRTRPNGTTGVVTEVMPAEVFGFEIEGIARLGDATSLSFALGHLDSEIGDFMTCDQILNNCTGDNFLANATNIQGNRLPKSPEWTLSLGAEHVFSLGSLGSLTPRVQFRFTDDQYLSQFNQFYDAEGSYTRTNLYLTYDSPEERFFAQAYVNNVEDEDVRNQILLGLVTFAHAQYDAPRTWGVRLGLRFD